MTEQIVALAADLGKVEAGEGLRAACRAAKEELASRLRAGIGPEDCGESFPLAAAYLALGTLETLGDDGVSAFTAGDVTIHRGDRSGRMNRLECQAVRLMQPYLRDEGFLFRGVDG